MRPLSMFEAQVQVQRATVEEYERQIAVLLNKTENYLDEDHFVVDPVLLLQLVNRLKTQLTLLEELMDRAKHYQETINTLA